MHARRFLDALAAVAWRRFGVTLAVEGEAVVRESAHLAHGGGDSSVLLLGGSWLWEVQGGRNLLVDCRI
jgi:hypothetical protein